MLFAQFGAQNTTDPLMPLQLPAHIYSWNIEYVWPASVSTTDKFHLINGWVDEPDLCVYVYVCVKQYEITLLII